MTGRVKRFESLLCLLQKALKIEELSIAFQIASNDPAMPIERSYWFGQKGPWYTDCSGFTKMLIPELKNGSYNQLDQISPVDVQNIMPGDLVFLKTGNGKDRADHVGIITSVNRKNGQVISYDVTHASSGKGRNTRTVWLGDKNNIFNSKLVGFGRLTRNPTLLGQMRVFGKKQAICSKIFFTKMNEGDSYEIRIKNYDSCIEHRSNRRICCLYK